MNYPSLENYNEALQHPALALVDPELKKGVVTTTGLGLPLALCGGFALTYTIKAEGKKYAVRCFHKQSSALETRYSEISRKLDSLRSPYFLDFEFQPQGVRANGALFPVVKMAWASGDTLGQFVEANHQNQGNLERLIGSIRSLAAYLEGEFVAHGDIQPGNVMVAADGRSIQLIDYDGMFVEELKGLGSGELGHRNFQHPNRTPAAWDARLDRFSFIAIDLALRALQARPELWASTQSDGDSFLFKANDFSNPGQSRIFQSLFAQAEFTADAKNLASICQAPFDAIPTLEDFQAGRSIPQASITFLPVQPTVPAPYISAYAVLEATDYVLCLGHVGDRVELIGKIVEIKEGETQHGTPYVFVNFAHWRGEGVKISVWSEGLAALTMRPDQSWVGRWLSVVGLMEPPYVNPSYRYSHLSISATQSTQMHLIDEAEALFRLQAQSCTQSRNSTILDQIRGGGGTKVPASPTSQTPASRNNDVLEKMRKGAAGYPPPRSGYPPPPIVHPVPQGAYARPQPAPRSQPVPSPANGPAGKARPDGSGCLATVFIILIITAIGFVVHALS